MNFIDEVSEEQERNSPVRSGVKANADKIQAARQAGKSLNAIYRTLIRQGHKVGKGYSSFRQAVLHLDKHGWPTDSAGESDRDRFADKRFSSDFE